MSIEELVREIQKALGVAVDGKAGPETQLRPAWAVTVTERQMLADMRGRVESGKPIFA